MQDPIRYGAYGRYVEVYGVHSESSSKVYTVARTAEGAWSCGCPRWTMNRNRPECKHIQHTKAWIARKRGAVDLALDVQRRVGVLDGLLLVAALGREVPQRGQDLPNVVRHVLVLDLPQYAHRVVQRALRVLQPAHVDQDLPGSLRC